MKKNLTITTTERKKKKKKKKKKRIHKLTHNHKQVILSSIFYTEDTIWLFHGHYIQDDHEGKDDWQFTLIDQCTTNAELRKREVYWQHRLKTFYPNGLNEREESCL